MSRRDEVRFLLIEGVIVLFGVLAALLVDGIREDAALRETADEAVQRVFVETQQNLDELLDMVSVVEDRLGRLRALKTEAPENASLADVVGRFVGYATPELNRAAWERLSQSEMSSVVDPDLLTEAFHLYEWERQFESLELEISRLAYSELFYRPDDRPIAILISERMMAQQLSWASTLIPMYEQFLSRQEGD